MGKFTENENISLDCHLQLSKCCLAFDENQSLFLSVFSIILFLARFSGSDGLLLRLEPSQNMILSLEGQLGLPSPPPFVIGDTSDSGDVVLVQLAVFLDFTEHRPVVDPSSIQILEVCPVLVVLASTRDRRPVRQPSRPNIANVSAVTLALPVVLLSLFIGEFGHRQTTEPLPSQILVPYLQTATGLGVPRVELVEVRLDLLSAVTSTATMAEEWYFLPV